MKMICKLSAAICVAALMVAGQASAQFVPRPGGGGGSTPTGTAGAPNSAVVTVQGTAGGTPIPISGSITATNPSVSATGATAPASATLVGVANAGNIVAWNGSVSITGTPTINLGTLNGAALDSSLTALSAKFGSIGQKTMTASAPVVLASDQSAIPVTGNLGANLQFGGTAALTGAGATGAASQRVTVAQDATTIAGSPNTTILPKNLVQVGGATLGAATAVGTAATGNVQTVNAQVLNGVTVTQATAANLNATIVGAVTSNAGTNLNTSALALESGGNLAAVSTNTARTAAGTTATNALPVQGVTGGVAMPVSAASLPLPTGAAAAANQPTNAAQASATTGQTGSLGLTATTTVAPTYTTATSNPLSTTIGGGLRVDFGGSAALPAGTATIGNVNQTLATNGFTRVTDGTNTANVKAASAAPAAADPALVVALSPNGAQATSALQTTGNTSLATIATQSTASPVVAGGSALNGLVLKASPGTFYGAYAVSSVAGYLMIFNSVTVPANGATTAGAAAGNMSECIPLVANQAGSISYAGVPPQSYTTGISVAVSTTGCSTLTLSATAFIRGNTK